MKHNKLAGFIASVLSVCLFAGAVFNISPASVSADKKAITIKLNKKNITIKKGEKFKLKAKVAPDNCKVTWKSSKKKIASVSKKGKVTAKTVGKSKITATASYKAHGKKYSAKAVCKVTVKPAGKSNQNNPAPSETAAAINNPQKGNDNVDKIVPITSITAKDTIDLKVGETNKIEPAIEPKEAGLSDCTITNTKDYVASVGADGTITAKYPGITVITIAAKSNAGINCNFRVRVTDDFAPPEGFDKENPDIEHGSLEGFNYPSDYRSGGTAHALAWFPPGYDTNKQYNLLFCLHGGMDNEYYWTGDNGGTNDGCSGDNVLDNLYAEGLMEDTIVVFTSGVINYDANKDYPNLKNDPPIGSDWINHYLLEYEILNNLLPYMREQYPVMEGAEHTAICGLSMGCGQSYEIGFKNPDVFDYIGGFSAGPFEGADQQFVLSEEDAEVMNNTVKLFFFMTGEKDDLRDDSMRKFIKTCDGYGLNHVFYEVPKYGHEDACWDRCLYAFMKYAFK